MTGALVQWQVSRGMHMGGGGGGRGVQIYPAILKGASG